MWLHPSQKLSSGNSSVVLASLGAPSWGAEQSCRVGDQLWVPPSSPPLPLLAVVTASVTSGKDQAFTMLCAPHVLRQLEILLDALRD